MQTRINAIHSSDYTIDSFVAAISSASTSFVNRAKAFFDPSGLLKLSTWCIEQFGLNPPDECVDLNRIDIVQLLQSRLNLPLVRLDIHDKNQRVVFLNLLHRTLCIQRVDNHFVRIETWVLRRSGEDKGLGPMKGGGEADFFDFLTVYLKKFSASTP